MDQKTISIGLFNKIRDNLVTQLLNNPANEQVKRTYVQLTGDNELKRLEIQKVINEVDEFLDSIYAEYGGKVVLLDSNYGESNPFYLRFSTQNLQVMNHCYPKIKNKLLELADKTGKDVALDFEFTENIQSPSVFKNMQVQYGDK